MMCYSAIENSTSILDSVGARTAPRLKRLAFGFRLRFTPGGRAPFLGHADNPQPLSCLHALPNRLA